MVEFNKEKNKLILDNLQSTPSSPFKSCTPLSLSLDESSN
jgi:hypothetical protein